MAELLRAVRCEFIAFFLIVLLIWNLCDPLNKVPIKKMADFGRRSPPEPKEG